MDKIFGNESKNIKYRGFLQKKLNSRKSIPNFIVFFRLQILLPRILLLKNFLKA